MNNYNTNKPEKRVLITGHMGFIGIWVSFLFKHRGWEVYGLDNRSSAGERLYDLPSVKSLFHSEINKDICDYEKIVEKIKDVQPDLIVHLAGQAIIPEAFRDPITTFRTNALGTLTILETSKRIKNLKATLCITSDKVYENNNSGHPFKELDLLGGNDIYSVSKSSAELISKAFYAAHSNNNMFSIQTIRLGNVVGGGDWSNNRLLPDLIKASENNTSFRVRYIDATRPFQHVSDVAVGILKIAYNVLEAKQSSYDTWNLGPRNNSFASVNEVITMFQKHYSSIKIEDEATKYKEDTSLSVDASKYSSFFGAPRDDSIEAIKRALLWYKDFYAGASPLDLMMRDLKEIGGL